jgi:hypothetical protein
MKVSKIQSFTIYNTNYKTIISNNSNCGINSSKMSSFIVVLIVIMYHVCMYHVCGKSSKINTTGHTLSLSSLEDKDSTSFHTTQPRRSGGGG